MRTGTRRASFTKSAGWRPTRIGVASTIVPGRSDSGRLSCHARRAASAWLSRVVSISLPGGPTGAAGVSYNSDQSTVEACSCISTAPSCSGGDGTEHGTNDRR